MKFLLRTGAQLVALWLLPGILVPASGAAQSGRQSRAAAGSQAQGPAAIIRGVKVEAEQDGPAVEIVSNRPLVPAIQKIDGPPRLVIDLPNANVSLRRKRFAVRSEQISAVRVDQFQNTPPITRVVVDMLQPCAYTWAAEGNRLIVHLRPIIETSSASQPPAVPAFTRGLEPAVVPVSPGSSGAVVLAGNRVAAGSSVTAGADAAILHLARGGEVRVCPGTTVSVTSSQNGRELMLGMSTGALEAHYALDASADSVLTPDFRVLLAGPGEFHFAISADSRGNTCVRAQPGNTASVIVSELMGDGTYQVKPSEQVVFRSGRLNLLDTAVPDDCGCPPPAIPVMRTSAPVTSDADLPASAQLAQPGDEVKPAPPPPAVSELHYDSPLPAQVKVSLAPRETDDLPASQPNEVHVQVDAPFVFRATDPQPQPAIPILEAERLPLAYSSRPAPLVTTVLPPPASQAQPTHYGFFRKIKGFFAAMFR